MRVGRCLILEPSDFEEGKVPALGTAKPEAKALEADMSLIVVGDRVLKYYGGPAGRIMSPSALDREIVEALRGRGA